MPEMTQKDIALFSEGADAAARYAHSAAEHMAKMRKLLVEAKNALNRIKRIRLDGQYNDSYELAAAISKYLRENPSE